MSKLTDALRRALPILEQLPDGQHWSVSRRDGLSMQAHAQETVKALRALFPNVIWKRTWAGGTCNWWRYTCTYEGLAVQIYACKENPSQCTARYETRQVEKQITDSYHVETVEEKVIVGWDCGDHETEEDADNGKQ